VDRILRECIEYIAEYDAILVDEGQDFIPEWWNCLRRDLKPEGEMLLAADATQDIYERSELWTEQSMKGCMLSPSWVRLEGSYRSPAILRPILRDFAETFLPVQHRDPPEEQTDFLAATEGACTLSWMQVSMGPLEERLADEVVKMMQLREPEVVAEADICIVTSNRNQGGEVVKILRDRGFKVVETFGNVEKDEIQRGRVERMKKLAFYPNSGSIKVTTIHSFKGLESRALIIGISDSDPGLVYAAISRLKRSEMGSHLRVVCEDGRYLEFGRRWPEFKEIDPCVDDIPF
jgi:superfamily I DNA/RNA helicase